MKGRRLLISILILFMSFSIVAVNAATNDSGTTVHSRASKNRHLTTFTKINSSYHSPKI